MSRPSVDIESSPLTIAFRALALVVTVVVTIILAFKYGGLPDEVATHFNFLGQADSVGSKVTIWLIPGVFLPIIAACLWLSFRPGFYNYPVPVTQDNAPRLYTAGTLLMSWVTAFLAVLYAGLILAIVFSFNSTWIIWPCIAGMVGAAIWMWRQCLR